MTFVRESPWVRKVMRPFGKQWLFYVCKLQLVDERRRRVSSKICEKEFTTFREVNAAIYIPRMSTREHPSLFNSMLTYACALVCAYILGLYTVPAPPLPSTNFTSYPSPPSPTSYPSSSSSSTPFALSLTREASTNRDLPRVLF